jgi:hypothetical protein
VLIPNRKVLPNGPLLVAMSSTHIAAVCADQQIYLWYFDASADGPSRTNPKKEARTIALSNATVTMPITAIGLSVSLLVIGIHIHQTRYSPCIAWQA